MLRIVSLVPSLTESLCQLGLRKHLVGCTSFCSEPRQLRKQVESVGGTKDANILRIVELKPTQVLVNTEENTAQSITELKTLLGDAVVIETFPRSPHEAVDCVMALVETFDSGRAFFEDWQAQVACLRAQVHKHAIEIAGLSDNSIARPESNLQERLEAKQKVGFSYFVWRNPWMVAGSQTYISNLLSEGGLQNLHHTSENLAARYPAIDPQRFNCGAAEQTQCRVLLFSSEPFNFKMRHIDEFCNLSGVATTQCLQVDGKSLSWHGTRLLQGYTEVLRIQKFVKRLIKSDFE